MGICNEHFANQYINGWLFMILDRGDDENFVTH